MAINPILLGQLQPAATTTSDLYTVPASTNTTVTSVTACNISGSAETFRVRIADAGAADADIQSLYHEFSIPANDTFVATIGVTLEATDVVRVRSSGGNIVFHIYGIEET